MTSERNKLTFKTTAQSVWLASTMDVVFPSNQRSEETTGNTHSSWKMFSARTLVCKGFCSYEVRQSWKYFWVELCSKKVTWFVFLKTPKSIYFHSPTLKKLFVLKVSSRLLNKVSPDFWFLGFFLTLPKTPSYQGRSSTRFIVAITDAQFVKFDPKLTRMSLLRVARKKLQTFL